MAQGQNTCGFSRSTLPQPGIKSQVNKKYQNKYLVKTASRLEAKKLTRKTPTTGEAEADDV
jgi:hypothetical protein